MILQLTLDTIICIMDTGLLFLFLSIFCPLRPTKRSPKLAAFLALLAIHLICSVLIVGSTPIKIGIFFVLDIAFCCVLFRDKIIKLLAFLALHYLIFGIIESTVLTVVNLATSWEVLSLSQDDYSLHSFAYIVLMRLLALALILFLRGIKRRPIPQRQWFLLLPVPTLTAVFVWLIYSHFWPMQNPQVNTLLMCIGVFLVIQHIFLFAYIAITQNSTERYYQIKNIYEQKSQYNSTIATFKRSMHKMGHDLRHHFVYLAGALERDDTEKAKEYLAGLDNRLTELTSVEVTGHMDVDAILYHKQMEAEEAGVHLRVEGNLPPALPISAVDLSVVMGNALDNAIRAAAPVEGVRDVLLSVHFNNGRLYIMVSNPYTGTLRRSPTGKLLSTKLGRGGLGVESIADVVKRNDGHMTVQTDNQQFILTLLLQAKNQD